MQGRKEREATRRASSQGSAGGSAGVLAVPRDRPLEPFAQRHARLEAEQLTSLARVEAPSRLAVRHRVVPLDLPCEAGELGDLLRELADRDLGARAEVDGLGAVVTLRG